MGSRNPEQGRDYSEKSRDNGWSLPPHPLQIAAWIVVLVLALIHYTTLVPALPGPWQPAGYIVPGVALVCQIVCHLFATSINPADPSVLRKRQKGDKNVASFDRKKHRHVIEDCHCYICEVDVESKSKHCSVCNKCVQQFDHHCKWLNNCVGSRNYRWFLATLMSSIVALLLVVVIALFEFITYFTDQTSRSMLTPYIGLNSTLEYKMADFQIVHQTVVHEGWLALVGITFILGLISLALLIHLFGFHCYLIYKGISTYEYIVQQREKEYINECAEDGTGSVISSGSKHGKRNKIMPSSDKDRQRKGKDKKEKDIPLDKRKSSEEVFTIPRHSLLSSGTADASVYQQIMRNADHRQEGETPPPSASPIRAQENNNNNYDKGNDLNAESTAIKKLRKKKKKKPSHTDETGSDISTIDHLKQYQNKGYYVAVVDVPSIENPVRVLPPPLVTPRGSGQFTEYHSDSADSLLEVPTMKSFSMSTKGALDQAAELSKDHKLQPKDGGSKKPIKKVKVKKQKKEEHVEDDEELLNSTMMFSLNSSAKFNSDGSLDYSNGFKQLPLTPTSLRKSYGQAPLTSHPAVAEIPPLDLTGLRGSQESVSFAPYNATIRSTDTFVTDRLPVLQEEMSRPVADTEV